MMNAYNNKPSRIKQVYLENCSFFEKIHSYRVKNLLRAHFLLCHMANIYSSRNIGCPTNKAHNVLFIKNAITYKPIELMG